MNNLIEFDDFRENLNKPLKELLPKVFPSSYDFAKNTVRIRCEEILNKMSLFPEKENKLFEEHILWMEEIISNPNYIHFVGFYDKPIRELSSEIEHLTKLIIERKYLFGDWSPKKRKYFIELLQSNIFSRLISGEVISNKEAIFLMGRLYKVMKLFSVDSNKKIEGFSNWQFLKMLYAVIQGKIIDGEKIQNFLSNHIGKELDDFYLHFLITQHYPQITQKKLELVENEIIDTVKDIEISNKLNNSKEFTISRQAIAIYYVIESLGFEAEFKNKTDMAYLVHLLAGIDLPNSGKMDDSSIYQKVKKIFKDSPKFALQDIDFVLDKFKKVQSSGADGINNIIKMIQNDKDSIKK